MAEQTIMVPATSTSAVLRQIGMLIGIAAAVALGVWVVLWSRTPPYQQLYTDLSDRDMAQVLETLNTNGIPYKVNAGSGALLVAADRVRDARLKLAGAGLPRSTGIGFELLEQESKIGTSTDMEKARFQLALENELARSISRIDTVKSARVHLAIPKQTVFMRSRPEPSASVLVDLYAGRTLEREQVGAITHLVASSVPSLRLANVTVVDQAGRLLNAEDDNGEIAASTRRLDYTRQIENDLAKRIESLLAPLVGHDGVKAQVSAEIDFTKVEKTSERYIPEAPAIVSEQTLEESSTGAGPGGVPGALSNQPPAESAVPEVADGGGEAGAAGEAAVANGRKQATRNYVIPKVLTHTDLASGGIRRLSVAVVVNDKTVVDDEGVATQVALEPEEIERLTALVKDAVGFDETRGDKINLTNQRFRAPLPAEPLPELPIWQQPWVWGVGKQVLGGLFVLFALFGVIRPAMRKLMERETITAEQLALATNPDGTPALPPGEAREEGEGGEGEPEVKQLKAPVNAEVESIKAYVTQEPKLAAQVVKGWVNDE